MAAGPLRLLGRRGSLADTIHWGGMGNCFVSSFSPDMRGWLIRVGQLGVLRSCCMSVVRGSVVASIAHCAMELSGRRFGGLISLQRPTVSRRLWKPASAFRRKCRLIAGFDLYPGALADGAVVI
jgi:hypothetical protein